MAPRFLGNLRISMQVLSSLLEQLYDVVVQINKMTFSFVFSFCRQGVWIIQSFNIHFVSNVSIKWPCVTRHNSNLHWVQSCVMLSMRIIYLQHERGWKVAVLYNYVHASKGSNIHTLLLHSYASMIVLLFCRTHFIEVYCHMLIAALEFMLRRSK